MDTFKACTKCGVVKSFSEFYYDKTRQRALSWCKQCTNELSTKRALERGKVNQAEIARKKSLLPTDQKRCTKCMIWKPFDAFPKRGDSDTLRSHCKDCKNEEGRAFKDRNSDQTKESNQ